MKPSRILVTGASGLLGCRLVERLLMAERVQVRAMAHRPERSSRLARLAVDKVWCDITSADQVRKAITGCDVIVHCAYGAAGYRSNNRKTTVDGTRILAEVAIETGVSRFVHISSVAVYSYSPPANVTEDSSFVPTSDNYCSDKIDAEKVVWRLHEKSELPLIVLRMGNIYGPFSAPWTTRPLSHIRDGKVSLVDGGNHNSNMVFVDNAVEAIIKSIKEDTVIGQAFFITDDPVSWRDLYGAYARWLGGSDVRSISSKELDVLLHPGIGKMTRDFFTDAWSNVLVPTLRYAAFRGATSPHLGRMASAIWKPVPSWLKTRILGDLSGKAIPSPGQVPDSGSGGLPQLGLLEVYAGRATFSNNKAKRILGYGPETGTFRALEITKQWASWARLI